MNKINTYSDEKMLYNELTKQYELNSGFVKGQFGNPYTDDAMLEMRIKKNTRKVYDYIFSRAYSGNRKIIVAIINHTEEYRNWIFDALTRQMEADITSGYNDQDNYVPENRDEREMQQLNQVSVSCENVLYDSIGYGGINLLYAGVFSPSIYLEFMEYVK